MRIRLVVIFVLAVASGSAVAQKSEIEFILRPALGSVWGALPDRQSMQGGILFTTGFGFGRKINTKSSIHVDLLANPMYILGEKDLYYSDPDTEEILLYKASSHLSFTYLTLPLEYRRRFGEKIILEYGAGVYVSYLLDHSYYTSSQPNYLWVSSGNSDPIDPKKGDFGLSASFRASYPFKDRVFVYIAINEYLGLLNINKTEPPSGSSYFGTAPPADYSIRNNSFGISFGISFQL